MSVEHVAANDGRGRLYARQIGAQSLPRKLRLLMYGDTRKEVDLGGAHYELTRALCKSQSLPSICVLRDWLKILWALRLACDANGDIGRAIKLFSIFFFYRWLQRISRILAVLGYEGIKQATPVVLRPKRKSSAHSL